MKQNPISAFGGWVRGLARRDLGLVVWSAILIVIVLICIFGPLGLQDPSAQDIAARLQGPSARHLLGTDEFGRDILSRTVAAGRISLALGFVITVLSIVIGSLIGVVSGYYRGASAVLMRLMDALLAFPVLVLAITLIVALGSQKGALAEAIALTVVFVPYISRVVRARTLVLAQRGYITAARASGTHSAKILLIHILPNALPTILVQATFIYASTLLADASLSFLGLGVAAPTPTWGNMVAEAKPYITIAPLFMIVPGLVIVLAVMSFNLIGDSIRTLIDPRARAVMSLQLLAKVNHRRGNARAAMVAPPVVAPDAPASRLPILAGDSGPKG